MPRPRFYKLEPEKQERIIRAAAQAFIAHGFEGASLNRIIEQAEISKGAVYYYFDDKADVLATVLAGAWDKLLPMEEVSVAALSAESYWPAIEGLYLRSLALMAAEPWLVGVGKLFYQLSPEVLAGTVVEELYERSRQLLLDLVERGQELELVRDDLPTGLLLAMLAGAGEACDRWMSEHWEQMPPEQALAASTELFAIFRKMVEPPNRGAP